MPNGAQIHLLLNHIPVFGTAFGILILVASMALKNESWRSAAMIVLLASALGTVPAYLTGEPAEEVVEEMQGIDKEAIEEHEDGAMFVLIGVELLGALALFGLWQSRGGGKVSSGVANSALVLGLIVMAIVARTAHQGGEIHHPEIRPGFTAPTE
jgi:uncharacterized membrane protein